MLDFETGTLNRRRPSNHEYYWLVTILGVTLFVYGVCGWYHPVMTGYAIVCFSAMKFGLAFLSSWQTDVSHHVRFLLSGSNPFGMTGGGALLLGGVDAFADWREDQSARWRRPWTYWPLFLWKFLLTPIGLVMVSGEILWDLILLRRDRRLISYKWSEFMALARYHDWICPEKSNDLFYADLAFARYKDDPYLYQWLRMRAMVFELHHSRLESDQGEGVSATNLFCQDELSAYQTLRRLRIEEIEEQLDRYYQERIDRFPLPARLAKVLISNARPLSYYLRSLRRILDRPIGSQSSWQTSVVRRELLEVVGLPRDGSSLSASPLAQAGMTLWHFFRMLDVADGKVTRSTSLLLRESLLTACVDAGVLHFVPATDSILGHYVLTEGLKQRWNSWLDRRCESIDVASYEREQAEIKVLRIVTWQDRAYRVVSEE